MKSWLPQFGKWSQFWDGKLTQFKLYLMRKRLVAKVLCKLYSLYTFGADVRVSSDLIRWWPRYNLYPAQRRMRPSSWRISIFIPGLRIFPDRTLRASAETVVLRTPTSIFAYQSRTVLVSWLNLIAILPFSRVYDKQFSSRSLKQIPRAKHANLSHTNAWRLHAIFQLWLL